MHTIVQNCRVYLNTASSVKKNRKTNYPMKSMASHADMQHDGKGWM